MNFYVFSGNHEWLASVQDMFPDAKPSSDYEELLAVKDRDETLIFTLHDDKNPMDPKGHPLPFCLNTFSHTPPGSFYSDRFLDIREYGKDTNILELVKDEMSKYKKLFHLLQKVQDGRCLVRYEGWSFSAGHEDDEQRFSLKEKDCGISYEILISVDENNVLDIYFPDGDMFSNSSCSGRDNEWLTRFARGIILDALKRDDPEICQLLGTSDGELRFPYDYHDISRADILAN